MTPQQQEERKKSARAFVQRWQKAEGSEQQEAAKFWIDLFISVLGVPNPADPSRGVLDFERRVKGRRIDVFHEDVGVLIEHKSRGVNLDAPEPRGKEKSGAPRLVTPFEQAKWYADNITPRSIAPRWLITCNFDELRIYDLDDENAEQHPERIQLADLPERLHRLSFLTRKENSREEREKQLSVAAGELVGRLYDALAASYHHLYSDPQEQRSLNILMTRIVFLLYAEDAGLLHEHSGFTNYLRDFKAGQTAGALRDLFDALKTPEAERDPYLSDALQRFPYINGGLFEQPITIAQFSEAARTILMEAARFDWKNISPTIFGAVFESTLNPATRRAGGMHYTSVENIRKVIDPLFLTELRKELNRLEGERNQGAKTRAEWNFRLHAFRKKLAALRILDPACGSGNFLTETYLCLRELENRVLQNLYGAQMGIGETDPIQVSIHQFYGLEINDFAVEVAKTALWIAEQQMLEATREILGIWIEPLPLKNNASIHCANALRTDWNTVLPAEQCSYVIGNPPFLGSSVRSKSQTADLEVVYGKDKKWGKCDYCVGWYRKASDYMLNTQCHAAFVSTNSITQGEQVQPTWERLFNMGVKIDFAWRTFVWDSEATDQAHVHCVIIGFSFVGGSEKRLYASDGTMKVVPNINGYLLDAANIFLPSRGRPVDNRHKPIIQGCKPVDGGGLILSADEREEFIRNYPDLAIAIRPYLGSAEFINSKERYCFWLRDLMPEQYETNPEIQRRLAIVREQRESSPTAEFRDYSNRPHLFVQDRQPEEDYLIVPQVSSERRQYIPVGFLSKEVIVSNLAYVIPGAGLFDFGLIMSGMFNAWLRIVAGRLESRYRFSPVVYNTFVYPLPSPEQRAHIETCAQNILDARAAHPGATLAQLYDPDKMPANLRAAHQHLDAAVEAAYGVNFNGDEERITRHLFTLYAAATKNGA